MKLEQALKFLENFSVITVGENKRPNFTWKNQMKEKLSVEKFTEQFNHNQDKKYIRKDGSEGVLCATKHIGLVTGFEDLEVIDIDLKVFSTTSEKREFWDVFLSLLRDAIFDFDEKFAIYKTINAGYHILYKSKRVDQNKKLAKLEKHEKELIETRGVGGYIFVYPDNKISKNSYFEIDYISDHDRNQLINISRSFNFIDKTIDVFSKIKKDQNYTSNGDTPWEDFDKKVQVQDLISEDFTVVRDLSDRIIIKKRDSKDYSHGTIYKKSNLLYLFTTSTIYPAEKALSPSVIYSIQKHKGDLSETARDLYNQGYGARFVKELKVKVFSEVKKYLAQKKDTEFPIDVFPQPFQDFIIECNDKLDLVIDYAGCSLLWLTSLMIGNTAKVRIKNGWTESPVVWIALVGKAGIGKSPTVNRMIYPLKKENDKLIQEYIKQRKAYDEYSKLDKKEKEYQVKVEMPNKTQFVVDDITLEALVDLHESVPKGIGVHKDELKGWLKEMNRYREGSDLEFWLSTWSGSSVMVNRITRPGSYVHKPFIPVIGGIQPNVLADVFTDEKKDNGFIDRMLICYPDLKVEYYNKNEMSQDAIEWYNDIITNLFRGMQRLYLSTENDDTTYYAEFDNEARELWINKFNEITDRQNSDSENEYFKSMYPKQKSYIPRFAFILNSLWSSLDSSINFYEINKKSMEGAIRLSDYFVANAMKIKVEKSEVDEYKKIVEQKGTVDEKLKIIYEIDKDFNKTRVAELLGVTRQTVYNKIKNM